MCRKYKDQTKLLLTGSFLLCLIKSCNDRSGNADVIDEAFWGIDMYLTIEGVSSHMPLIFLVWNGRTTVRL